MAKLTLSLDEQVVREAKRLAARQGTSVSAMFERFIRLMTRGDKEGAGGPITRELTGIIKIPKGKDYRDLLEDALTERIR